jgi:hypothetical protein
MTQVLIVFAATYVSVFTLGLQSLNVNGRHYLAAGVTSIFIGGGHLLLYRAMPSAAAPEIASYLAGGVTGICSSIWFHARAKGWLSSWLARRRAARPQVLRDEHEDVDQCGALALSRREVGHGEDERERSRAEQSP